MDRFIEAVFYYTLLTRGNNSVYELITTGTESRLYNNRAIMSPVSPYIVFRNTETSMVRTMTGTLEYDSGIIFDIYTNDHQTSLVGNKIQALLVNVFNQGEFPEYEGIKIKQCFLMEANTEDAEDYFCHHTMFKFMWQDLRG